MRKSGDPCPRTALFLPSQFIRALLLFLLLGSFGAALAQSPPAAEPFYARKNTFSVFAAYSNDSSHILLGAVDNRKLLEIGASYGRRLFVNRIVNWQYNGEVLPVALESDPVTVDIVTWTSPTPRTEQGSFTQIGPCIASSGTFSNTINGVLYSYNYSLTCGRQWTIGEAMSPVGMQWNFLPHHRVQPFFIGHGGYMYTTQPIPVANAGSFNFTFDLGAGIEIYRSHTRSIRAEYRYHHISNHETAMLNPGIDNGLFQVTYSFGR